MIVYPIIPIWIMGLVCIILIVFVVIKGRRKWGLVRQILIIILLFAINLRVMIKSPNSEVMSNNLDVLFVIDNSLSMLAEDYNGNEKRMDAVKNDCKHIMDELNGSRFSVITFDDTAQIAIPYTRDINLIYESLEILITNDSYNAKGTTLNVAKDLTLESLKNISEDSSRSKIIFFMSDGEITNGEGLESFSKIKQYVDSGAVLGYGTKSGGKMLVKKSLYEDEEIYLQDKTNYPYVDAVSYIDEGNLKSIANDIGVDYINMSKQSNIDSKLKEIKNGVIKKVNKLDKSSYKDTYYFFVIPLIIILIYEFIIFKRRL